MRLFTLGICCLCLVSGTAQANVGLGAAETSNVIQHSNRQITNKSREKQEIKLLSRQPRRKISGQANTDLDTKSMEFPESSKSILIKEIIVDNNTILKRYEVDRITRKYLGRYLTPKDLDQIKIKLSELYRRKGYITSFFFIPKQDLRDGVLQLRAMEGTQAIDAQDGQYYKARSYERILRKRKGNHQLFNIKDISKDLSRVNENPDINLKINLEKGDAPGETKVSFIPNDEYPWHFNLFTDNLGRASTGRVRGGFGVTHNNLLTLGDTFYSQVSINPQFAIGVHSKYEIPINNKGTKLGFSYSRNQMWLKGVDSLRALDLEGLATTYSPYIIQELFRGDRVIVKGGLSFDIKESRTDLKSANIGDFNRDRVRTLRPSLTLQEADRFGNTYVHQELGIGLDVLGARTNAGFQLTREGSKETYLVYRGEISRVNRLRCNALHLARLSYQYSPSYLNGLERFQLGGAYSVRGYEEGSFIGDSGFALLNEIRIPFLFLPDSWGININRNGTPTFLSISDKKPVSRYRFAENLYLAGFIDMGGSFNHDGLGNPSSEVFALGTGVGLRANLTDTIVGRLDIGFPLIENKRDPAHDVYVHFGLDLKVF